MHLRNQEDKLVSPGHYRGSYILLGMSRLLTTEYVMFEWNALLNLSRRAVTKTFSSLETELLLRVLCKRTRTMTVGVIHGDEGVGDIPGVRGGSGGLQVQCNKDLIDTRTQT